MFAEAEHLIQAKIIIMEILSHFVRDHSKSYRRTLQNKGIYRIDLKSQVWQSTFKRMHIQRHKLPHRKHKKPELKFMILPGIYRRELGLVKKKNLFNLNLKRKLYFKLFFLYTLKHFISTPFTTRCENSKLSSQLYVFCC